MTDWCYGLDVNNNVAFKDQEHCDRLPSPDTWMQWETCGGGAGGNFGWANNFDFGAIENVKPQRRTLFSGNGNQDMSQFHVEQSLNTDDFGLSSGDSHSFLHNPPAPARGRPDYYDNDDLMTGTDTADDIFLSSLFQDDVLPLQSLYIEMPSDSDSTNKMMDMQSISSDTAGVRSFKGFTNQYYSNSHASDNTSNQSSFPSEKARDEAPSDHKIARKTADVNNLSSIEESVLTGLETVLNQLNDETRLCLRDSMYRLARHSEEQTSKNEGQFSDEPSIPESSDVCSRSRAMEAAESETNAVDRAVAYMMFNKVDGNQQDHITASPPDFVHNGSDFAANGGCGFNEGLAFSPSDSLVQCEVPVLSQQAHS